MPGLINWSQPKNGLRIACVFPHPFYRLYQPITATVLVENVSNRPVTLLRSQPVKDYGASLKGPNGRPVATTAEYAAARSFADSDEEFRAISTEIAAGDTLEEFYEVSRWFAANRTGDHVFTLQLLQWRSGGTPLTSPASRFALMRALRP
jgi:hypothetical protein